MPKAVIESAVVAGNQQPGIEQQLAVRLRAAERVEQAVPSWRGEADPEALDRFLAEAAPLQVLPGLRRLRMGAQLRLEPPRGPFQAGRQLCLAR